MKIFLKTAVLFLFALANSDVFAQCNLTPEQILADQYMQILSMYRLSEEDTKLFEKKQPDYERIKNNPELKEKYQKKLQKKLQKYKRLKEELGNYYMLFSDTSTCLIKDLEYFPLINYLDNTKHKRHMGFLDSAINSFDTFPMYPLGVEGFRNDVSNMLVYPEHLLDVDAKLTTVFFIETDGTIKYVYVIEDDINKHFVKSAIEAILNVKCFVPAYADGKPVRMGFVFPIVFVSINDRNINKRHRSY